jgi:hypothetical protein
MARERVRSEQQYNSPGVPLLIAIASLPITFVKHVVWLAKTTWGRPSTYGALDLTLMTAGPLAFVLFEQLLARLRWQTKTGPDTAVHQWTTDHVLNAGLLAAFAVMCAYAARVWWHRYEVRGPSEPSRDPRLTNIVRAFLVGTLAGMAVRFYLGDVTVHEFAAGNSPIMAGLLFGVILVRTEGDSARSVEVNRELQLGAIYVLLGAIATGLGTIPASGWFFGTCFLVICGSLAATAYLVLTMTTR